MKHRTNRGPRTVPWGTPERTSADSDSFKDHSLFSVTEKGLSPAFGISSHSIVVQLVK